MLNRFEGEAGKRLRLEALAMQKLVAGNLELAELLDARLKLKLLKPDEMFIEQNGSDNDVYLIFVGAVNIVVNGRLVGRRGPGDSVGEMAAIEPTQRRAASVIAVEETLVAVVAESDIAELAGKHPQIYRCIAKELARRLLQRNALVSAARDRVRVFIISSAEALPVARIVQNAFAHDAFTPIVWTDDVFKVSNYTLQTLEDAVDDCDFAIAIAHSDDITECRGKEWPAPRDNVIFELGLFMGRLGKERAVLMEPRDDGVKLPSDLTGITTVPYRYTPGKDAAAHMAPACNALRDHITRLGPNN
jgi:predicted nucleotide-binding protein